MDVQLLLVPYDTARPRWRSGAGPEHMLQAGLAPHLHSRGHNVKGPVSEIELPLMAAEPKSVKFNDLEGVLAEVKTTGWD